MSHSPEAKERRRIRRWNATRWICEHRGSRDMKRPARKSWKVAHFCMGRALQHLRELNEKQSDPARGIYPCWWGEDHHDGETAPLHWHVGRLRESGDQPDFRSRLHPELRHEVHPAPHGGVEPVR